MPYCTRCAHAVPDAGRYCPACGAPVEPSPPGVEPADPGRTMASTPPSSSSSASGLHGRFDPGTRLGTRYRIVALLGRGGMGEVYRADDLELGQSVALKFLPPAVAGRPEDLKRFRGEVRVARQIAHPNVCRVYDIGEADGMVFLSMEYIDGEDLESVLRRLGRPTADKAIEIARQICHGLAAAHEAGMLHRDLKPANIMIDGRGRARITDFGLAGLADELAQGGDVAGTPAYMAPEQLTGGRPSVRSDLYGLGLVLYELFTGKRVHPTGNLNELRRRHESGTITTPSDIARDIDPAVERLILHCLERDPESRPPSAYAVLGALPGGDPLAAALAAGETPSPELVANAGDRGGLSPGPVAGLIAAVLLGIGIWAGTLGPEFAPLTTPTQVLSVRADDILARTGVFAMPPKFIAEGFAQNGDYLRHLRLDRAGKEPKHSAVFFWRRWSPGLIESRQIHTELPDVASPTVPGTGEAAILLDPAGRLIGLRAVPRDSLPGGPAAAPDWAVLFAAAGLDRAAFQAVPLVRPVPATCDSAAAWRGPLPSRGGEVVTVQMGASRGRLVHYTTIHGWGTTTAPLDTIPGPASDSPLDWVSFVFFGLFPLVGSIFFGLRNLQLGRGDWRSATRIAAFVFLMNAFEAIFATRLSEVGLLGAGWDLSGGRGYGHALIHAVGMWFAYVAVEPYVRRLWPRILVGWTRFVSGRVRDPLVGRDILIGAAAGALIVALGVLAQFGATRAGLARVPTLLNPGMLESLSGLPQTAVLLSYAGSVCVLGVLGALVLLLLFRLFLRRTDLAVALAVLLTVGTSLLGSEETLGWPLATFMAVLSASTIVVLMQFGLLAAGVAAFVGLVMGSGVGSLDLSSWYADRALVPLVLLLGLTIYGAATALSGKSILGDPLRESER